MNKEIYMVPEMDITYFEAEDVITTSGDGTGDETGDSPYSLFDLKLQYQFKRYK